jgi:hypothetical protein
MSDENTMEYQVIVLLLKLDVYKGKKQSDEKMSGKNSN